MYSAQQRVEFFQSESDFGSQSSMNNSRFYDFTNDIISETDNMFLTLKKQLKPNQKLSEQQKVKYVLSRAQILCKDTIPEHLAYLNKIGAPANAKSQIMVCSQKLNKLLADYQSLKNTTMIYKQFFNIYGKEFGYSPEASFVKGERVLCVEDQNEAVLKPECIQINYNNSNAKFRATPRVFMAANPPSSDKEVAGLKEEIYLLKKSIEEMKKNYDVEITNQKLLTQKRIQTYLRAQSFNDNDLQKMRNEVEQYSFKLSCSEEENRKLKARIEEYQKNIQLLQAKNQSLENEIVMLRKRDITIEEDDVHDRSYTSEMNEKEEKKTDKKIKILIHENQLLKSQLKTERQKFYRVTSDLSNEERGLLERLKKQVQKKNSQLEQLYSTLDKQRIQLLQVNHNNKALAKMNQSLKQEGQEIKKQIKTVSRESTVNLYPLPSATEVESSMVQSRKLQVSEYEGEGIEGLPYYQILNKQFKIRFRRSCLKDKELLHKANGLEIGVISKFEKPNKIDLLLHISNYSQFAFRKVKGKVLNANDNKIGGDSFEYPEISQGDQVKVPVSLLISNYPLGPLILALQYQTDKREELRILLPVHIFKMMEFQERTEPLKHPESISIITERKINKNLDDLKGYLKAGKIVDGCLKLSAFHRHTHTQVHLDIEQTKEGVLLKYNHYEGNTSISDYFIRTLVFLLKK